MGMSVKILFILLVVSACGDGLIEQKVETTSEGSEQSLAAAETDRTEECLRFVEIEETIFCELPNGDLRPVEGDLE